MAWVGLHHDLAVGLKDPGPVAIRLKPLRLQNVHPQQVKLGASRIDGQEIVKRHTRHGVIL